MGMVVRTNTMAINANRQLGMNNTQVAKSLEKLSSGFKINRAGDDASGLAISEKMKAQIKGLDQASANAQDGISLIQTAEGNLTEVHDMLNRMVELTEKSANGTIQDEVDREAIQDEMDALAQEIDRIADSANFNNIKLFDGSLSATTTTAATAISSTDPSKVTDGQAPSAATKATYTIKLDDDTPTTGIAITGGTTTYKALGELTANGHALKDLFVVTVGGTEIADWTDNTSKVAKDATIVLTAKTAGALESDTHNALAGIGAAADLSAVNGTAEGAGSAATKSSYKLEFDFTKLADGQTFTIGDKTFEISTDGALDVGSTNVLIDLKGLDLTIAGADNAKGQWGAAKKIQEAISGNTGLGTTDFSYDAVITSAPSGSKYTLNFTAKAGGDSGNLGQVRVSEATADAIKGTYTAGKPAGAAKPGTFATVEYDFDLSKLAEGDTLTIGGKKIEIVKDADEDLLTGKIGTTKAGTAANLVNAFESLGFAAGKLDISADKIKITDTTVGRTGDIFKADNNSKIAYTTNGGATTTTGGLKLQIGDTNDDFNKLRVSMDDMHMSALFDSTALTDADYAKNGNTLGTGTAVLKTAGTSQSLDVTTQDKAGAALKSIRKVIDKVSTQRGNLGAIQNRLEHTINNLDVTSENMTAANSRIRDTDMAKEMMNYTKMNVLVQSAQAMLAQANQQPQSILQLLQ